MRLFVRQRRKGVGKRREGRGRKEEEGGKRRGKVESNAVLKALSRC